MKKRFVLGCALTILFSLSSCGQDLGSSLSEDSTQSTTYITTSNLETTNNEESFDIQTSDNGLSATNETYVFSKAKSDDLYPPEASIRLLTNNSWRYCTGLNKDYTKIIIENEDVLTKESVSLDIVTNSDLVGSSGSNEIAAIDIRFDRKLINPGESRLKIQVKPSNGSSSINVLTTICLNIVVKEYGSIEVDTYNIGFNVDLSSLQEIISSNSVNPTEISFNLTDNAEEKDVYGYSADYHVGQTIDLENIPASIEVNNIKYAVGHTYSAWIFIDCDDYRDRIWISLISEEQESSYTLEENENGSSNLNVLEDNTIINAKLGSCYKI